MQTRILNIKPYFSQALSNLPPKKVSTTILPLLPSIEKGKVFPPLSVNRILSALPPVVSTLTFLPKDAKICFYKGTFNPPHKGHLANIKDALAYTDADYIAVTPNAVPPHKKNTPDMASLQDRIDMLRLATRGMNSKVLVFSPDLLPERGSEYLNTLGVLEKALPDFKARKGKISFLRGSDSLFNFLNGITEKKLSQLKENIKLFHAPRDNMPEYISSEHIDHKSRHLGITVFHLPNHDRNLEFSSSIYRNNLNMAAGNIDPFVQAYIAEKALYKKKLDKVV